MMRYKVKRLPADQHVEIGHLPLMYGVYGNKGYGGCLIAVFLSEAEADIFCAIKNAFIKHQK